jgi:hypothetical protein
MALNCGSNVYAFMTRGGAAAAADAEAEPGRHARTPLEDMRHLLSCLEYLYGEAVRLQARTSAHLIGAAAESLRREIAATASAE